MRCLSFALVALLVVAQSAVAQSPDLEESGLRTALFNLGKKARCVAPNTGCNATQTCQVDAISPLKNECVNCLAPAVNCKNGEVCKVDSYMAANNVCVECTRNEECSGDTPFCNLDSNTCVECTSNLGCSTYTTGGSGKPVCNLATSTCVTCIAPNVGCRDQEFKKVCGVDSENPSNNRCVECIDDSSCGGDICSVANGFCVECINNGDCASTPSTPVCIDYFCVPGCVSDAQCLDSELPYCNTEIQSCVQCLADDDCATVDGLPVCLTEFDDFTCVQCVTDANCANEVGLPFCQTDFQGTPESAFQCVECLENSDCQNDQTCELFACEDVPP